jgi:hypothetical protein
MRNPAPAEMRDIGRLLSNFEELTPNQSPKYQMAKLARRDVKNRK